MNGTEYTAVINAFLYETLSADADLAALVGTRIYDTNMPQATTEAEREALYPATLFYPLAFGRALRGNGTTIIWVPSEYVVIGMDVAEWWGTVEQIGARLLQLLGARSNVNVAAGGYINNCTYRRPERMTQTVNDVQYNRCGGVFEINARLSAS